jgi:predicted RNA-binding protein with PIN domain
VVFTDAGRTADDEIVARVNAAPPERPVVVVSSDNELRERSAALGASVTRAPALLGLANR